MIDYTKELVKALRNILPVYHELVLTSETKAPCISYQERNNFTTTYGDKLGYSNISYTVKVWGTDIEAITAYALEIDSALRPLGFKRVSSGELYDINSTMIQKILTYEALALESY